MLHRVPELIIYPEIIQRMISVVFSQCVAIRLTTVAFAGVIIFLKGMKQSALNVKMQDFLLLSRMKQSLLRNNV